MQYFFTHDFDGSISVTDFFTQLDKSNGKLYNMITVGPGGGNPCATVMFTNLQDVKTYVTQYDPDEFNYHMSRVQTVSFT